MPKNIYFLLAFLLLFSHVGSVGAQKIVQVSDGQNQSSEFKFSESWLSTPQTLTVTLDSPLLLETPQLALQLADGNQLRFQTMQVPATPETAVATYTFMGNFSGAPSEYTGGGQFLLSGVALGVTKTVQSPAFQVKIDTIAPKVVSVRPVGDLNGVQLVQVEFAEKNPRQSYASVLFELTAAGSNTDLVDHTHADLAVSNNIIAIPLKMPITGLATLHVKNTGKVVGQEEKQVELTDELGNKLQPSSFSFAAAGQRPAGPAVDFPPFAVPSDAPRHSDSNKVRPSSRVVTRVVNLYYYRNAHRVAEIINRRTQQYNLASTQAKQNLAAAAADRAENATIERRQAERDAELAAKRTREVERELNQLQADAEESQTVLNQLAGYPNNSYVVPVENGQLSIVPAAALGDVDPANLTSVAAFRTSLEKVITNFNEKKSEYEELRRLEEQLNNRARSAEDSESRLIRAQFLRELDATQEDRNTYAAANIDSIDPVMQTSVSVIGEGRLQLRGPIEGINQIRRLINQIDVPVGQVKVDLETVQINGEKGPELEETIQLVEGYINCGRFLTNQSLVYLRRSVAEVASEVAQESDVTWQRDQIGRDSRYLYSFFGQDFIDTLYRMDSEFLHTENQILSLHSMDSISRNRAMLLIGLAKNSVRQRILDRFQQYISNDLPNLEFNYRSINQAIPCQYLPECKCERVSRIKSFLHPHQCECPIYCLDMAMHDAQTKYQFLNFQTFFSHGTWNDATLNPMQREFIRLAQIFKSQLIAEIELKQRIVERGLVDQQVSEDEKAELQKLLQIRTEAIDKKAKLLSSNLQTTSTVSQSILLAYNSQAEINRTIGSAIQFHAKIDPIFTKFNLRSKSELTFNALRNATDEEARQLVYLFRSIPEMEITINSLEGILPRSETVFKYWAELKRRIIVFKAKTENEQFNDLQQIRSILDNNPIEALRNDTNTLSSLADAASRVGDALEEINKDGLIQQLHQAVIETNSYVTQTYDDVLQSLGEPDFDIQETLLLLSKIAPLIPANSTAWRQAHAEIECQIRTMLGKQTELKATENFLKTNRLPIQQLKLLDHLIDEYEEKAMDLLEGKRSHISAIDNFLKRMTAAIEDDFQIQFYDPALVCIRHAARGKQVTLSQVERTTVLGNNRELMKVLPQATMEFDLPNRGLRVTEAFQNAKALVDDYGALLNDPTFLSAYQMVGGSVPAESVRSVIPGLPDSTTQKFHALPAAPGGSKFGSLQDLVPDPEIYKFETGTGFEIRPVIQPDGDSIVYDLNYLYTTEIREPVRADEKHLGRVKRHFINTQVQTSSFEWREVGRYQVALKAARTSRGVPMLEKAPLVGPLFRPAPSEESSIQENILLGKSVVYPTLYDLMGLKWAQHVAEMGYDDIRNAGHVARGRQTVIKQHVFDESSRNVDDFLRIESGDEHYRPDLYHEHKFPSPYHPNGYVYPKLRDDEDPSRRGFRIQDRRPSLFKQGENGISPAPEYDNRFGVPSQPLLPLEALPPQSLPQK